jgi:hypothetical protein
MGFSKKIKAYFTEKGLTNRDVSRKMEGYSESLISRHMNSDVISKTFIDNIAKYFPDIDMNYMLRTDEELEVLNDIKAENRSRNLILIEEIRIRLDELSRNVSRD